MPKDVTFYFDPISPYVYFRAGIAADKLRVVSGKGPYASQARAMANSMVGEASVKRQSAPELIADTIAKAVSAKRPKTQSDSVPSQ